MSKSHTKTLQSKLPNFGSSKLNSEASKDDANTSLAQAMPTDESMRELDWKKFCLPQPISECFECVAQAEIRISTTEDDMSSMQNS